MNPNKPIIALDFATVEELIDFIALFPEESLNLKIGMEMYYMTGPALVKQLIDQGHDIFLDLKLHDIPNTVKRSMSMLATLGISMVNVHAMGGSIMMEAARQGLEEGTPEGRERPILLAVTQLTSTTQQQVNDEQLSQTPIDESVLHYASLTAKTGLDGVVCSPLETADIKTLLGQEFLTVTPGIRLTTEEISGDDKYRIATPSQAAQYGSDYIVVGRPITRAKDPVKAYQFIARQWQQARDAYQARPQEED